MIHASTDVNKRKTDQYILPLFVEENKAGRYNIYPGHKLPEGNIFSGFESLTDAVVDQNLVLIDGYQGVYFEYIISQLQKHLKDKGKKVGVRTTYDFMLPFDEIESLVSPFMGGDDPVFGKVTTLKLIDFFQIEKLIDLDYGSEICDIILIYGPGAFLACDYGFRVYIDLPKNELQFRARAGSIFNLGSHIQDAPNLMYKRFYFIDWIVLNDHKSLWAEKMDIIVDGQRENDLVWAYGDDFRKGIQHIAKNVFRVRPWFEPGVWGGNWIIKHIDGLNKNVKNYAWSFELITPENGIIFYSNELNLEVSFDFLMYLCGKSVLGGDFDLFGFNFPIRFDFLDTFDGGNLSVQCHPTKKYIQEHFNERITQEETYYILDAKDDATVYLGFQDDIDPQDFKTALQSSFESGHPLDIEKYVQKLPAKKHDLFLIPPGTIHASGINNLVLEISATPYIFTFKMYDWVRPDLNGKPRPLNIGRGFENLNFSRKGSKVQSELICHPALIQSTPKYDLWHLPTHQDHLYDVHRICLRSSIEVFTDNKCHVMSLVQGKSIRIETKYGTTSHYSYAETFVIPAAAESYTIINENDNEVMIIKAFVK